MTTLDIRPETLNRLLRPEDPAARTHSVPLRTRLMSHVRHLVATYGEIPLLKIHYLRTGRADERVLEWAKNYELSLRRTPAVGRKLEQRLRRELQALKAVAAEVSEHTAANLYTLDKLSDAELLELHSRLLLKLLEPANPLAA